MVFSLFFQTTVINEYFIDFLDLLLLFLSKVIYKKADNVLHQEVFEITK